MRWSISPSPQLRGPLTSVLDELDDYKTVAIPMTRPIRVVVTARTRPRTFCGREGELPLFPVERGYPLGVEVMLTTPWSIRGGLVELSLSSMYASCMVMFKHSITGLILNWWARASGRM